MANHPVQAFYGDDPPNGAGDGTIWISSAAPGAAGKLQVFTGGVSTGGSFKGLFSFDDFPLGLGDGQPARIVWETADANANELLIQLPAGGAVDVPVIVIGQGVVDVDLGLYDGVVNPRVAMFGVGAVSTGPVVEFRKARGSVASPTVVTTGDDLGTLDFYGAVAAGEYVRAASIRADMAGTIATTRGPGNLSFNVATDAAPSVMTERLLITASGQINLTPATDVTIANATGLVVGHTAQVAFGGATPELQVLGTADADSGAAFGRWSADANGAVFRMGKSRNAAIGSFTIVQANDDIATIQFVADDGVDMATPVATIVAQVDGTPGADDMPGRLVFLTTADAGNSVTERLRIDSAGTTTVRDTLALGAAGTAKGVLKFNGNTSGTVTVQSLAAAGTYTLTLPPDDGDAGEQLQTDGSGVLTFEAAGSLRAFKNILGQVDPKEGLKRVLSAPVYEWTYKKPDEAAVRLTTTGDRETHYVGVVAEDAPWLMHHKGRIFSPVSAFGHAALAIQALVDAIKSAKSLKELQAQLA